MRPLGSLSFSEVQDLCTKAARGAGLDWGLSEEAGFTARWLYARGLNGPSALLRLLEDESGKNSPLVIGTSISDRAATLSDVAVRKPLLLLPYLHLVAKEMGHPVLLTWQNGQASVTSNGVIKGAVRELASEEFEIVSITFGNDETFPNWENTPVELSPTTIEGLNRFAMKTTVPATAASRADAGAGESDND